MASQVLAPAINNVTSVLNLTGDYYTRDWECQNALYMVPTAEGGLASWVRGTSKCVYTYRFATLDQ